MAVSKAAIGATAGTGTAAAAATTALTVGGGTSSEKISDSLDSVSEPSVNKEGNSSVSKTTEKALDEKVDLEGTSDQVETTEGPGQTAEEVPPAVPQKSPDELIKEEINSKDIRKTWTLTNSVFMSSLEPYYCLQKLFDEELSADTRSDLASQANHKVFEGNESKAFGCLGVSYFKRNKKDTDYWKGISAWEWGIRKGDEGFIYLGSFKNSDKEDSKINYFSKAYHIKKEGGSWVPKYYKGVESSTLSISESDKKVPKGSTKLPGSKEEYVWGYYSETTKNNACKFDSNSEGGNCGFHFSPNDDITDTEVTNFWYWEEGEGSSKFSDMQSNFNDWWSNAFPNDVVDLQGAQDKVGTWTAW